MDSQKYAILSVYDKNGIGKIARHLFKEGYTLLSTGGTYRKISEELGMINDDGKIVHSSRVVQISRYTGFPEILDGRVKTLHPRIYGSLLARRDKPEHMAELVSHNIPNIDVVVVNLYPFHLAVQGKADMNESLELIDIGGVSLIRAAAKNWQNVAILTDPSDYDDFIQGRLDPENKVRRLEMSVKAFQTTSEYDSMINQYLGSSLSDKAKSGTIIRREYTGGVNLKYGCNPHQGMAGLHMIGSGKNFPIRVVNGKLGYINVLDALAGWQLVREARRLFNLPAVTSFKHTSPAGVGLGVPITGNLRTAYGLSETEGVEGNLATAFIRARYADPMSSFGDFIALSDVCDLETAKLIRREVSDGVIAPGYTADALPVLQSKRSGNYLILQIDPQYEPRERVEVREMFGLVLTQEVNRAIVDFNVFTENNIPTQAKDIDADSQRDLLLANLTLKYSQSNNVVMAQDGQVIAVAAGQQSRVDCVKLAKRKAEIWMMRQHPKVLSLMNEFKPEIKRQDQVNAIIRYIEGDMTEIEFDEWSENFKKPSSLKMMGREEKISYINQMRGVCLASDAFFPFRDNIDHASQVGVRYIIQPGGSLADPGIIQACDEYGMSMVFSGKRMFTH